MWHVYAFTGIGCTKFGFAQKGINRILWASQSRVPLPSASSKNSTHHLMLLIFILCIHKTLRSLWTPWKMVIWHQIPSTHFGLTVLAACCLESFCCSSKSALMRLQNSCIRYEQAASRGPGPLIPLPVEAKNLASWCPCPWPAEGPESWAGEQKVFYAVDCESPGIQERERWLETIYTAKYSLGRKTAGFSYSCVTMRTSLFHFFNYKFYDKRDSSIFFVNIPQRPLPTVSEY